MKKNSSIFCVLYASSPMGEGGNRGGEGNLNSNNNQPMESISKSKTFFFLVRWLLLNLSKQEVNHKDHKEGGGGKSEGNHCAIGS